MPTNAGMAPVLSAYSGWIERHYRERRGLPEFKFDVGADGPIPDRPTGHSITREMLTSQKGKALRLSWAYPVDGDQDLEWRNEVRIAAFGELCAVEHSISVSSIEYRIVPARLELGSPGVIRRLCSDIAVRIGDMTVKATPYPLSTDSVGKFIELLQSPMRRLPIVFISPYAKGQPNALNVQAMAQRLAGVAVVVEVREPEATWTIGDAIGDTLSCFDGGARIYWPGFSVKDDKRSHRLYLGATVRSVGPAVIERSIERSIFAVAAFRFVPDARITEIIREAEQAQRVQRVETQKASGGEDWENYALELDEKLTNADQTISDLQAEIENLKANQQVFFSARALGEPEEEAPQDDLVPPDSVEAALAQAADSCKNLVLLDSAFEAAKKSPFKRPAEILSALSDLDEIAKDWTKQRDAKGTGGDLLQHLKDKGWGKRASMHISNTTKAKEGTHYEFEYNGARQMFEPHVTIGSGDANYCASIHFILDQKTGKIVIGHVGRHLPNTKT